MILLDGYLMQRGSYWEGFGILWSVDRLRLKDFGVSAFNLRNAADEVREFLLDQLIAKEAFRSLQKSK